jgi:Rad3-related DNA helicase
MTKKKKQNKTKQKGKQAWWFMLVIPAHRRLRQED